MAGSESPAEADRATVLRFLDRDDVRTVAADNGIDVERVERAVEASDAGTAADLAERVRDAEDQLAGGDTFVISTTTIIIALLVIILIIVA